MTAGSEVGDAVLSLLDDNKVSLELVAVWLGDQYLLPTTPSACVVVGPTNAELVGAPRRIEETFEVTVIVYHCRLTDGQITERECNQRAEAVRAFLDDYDKGRLDGQVLHSMITSIEPGYVNRGTATAPNWYRTSRLTWQGMTRRNLAS